MERIAEQFSTLECLAFLVHFEELSVLTSRLAFLVVLDDLTSASRGSALEVPSSLLVCKCCQRDRSVFDLGLLKNY